MIGLAYVIGASLYAAVLCWRYYRGPKDQRDRLNAWAGETGLPPGVVIGVLAMAAVFGWPIMLAAIGLSELMVRRQR